MMIIGWTLGTIAGTLLTRTPFMMLFLMHDYLGTFIWVVVDTIRMYEKKVRK